MAKAEDSEAQMLQLKQEVIMNVVMPIQELLMKIRQEFGITSELSVEFSKNKKGNMLLISVDLPEATLISNQLPVNAWRWTPKKVMDTYGALLRSVLEM